MGSSECFIPSNPGRLLLNHPSSPAQSLCIFPKRPELSPVSLPRCSCTVLLHSAPEVLQTRSLKAMGGCAISAFGVRVCTQQVLSNDLNA